MTTVRQCYRQTDNISVEILHYAIMHLTIKCSQKLIKCYDYSIGKIIMTITITV